MKRMCAALVLTLAAGLLFVASPSSFAAADDDAYFSSLISVRNKTFYPLVRDGFKDAVILELDSDQYSRMRATVVNGSGRAVRSMTARAKCGDDDCEWFVYQWVWNGKRDDGTLVKKGTYSVELSAVTQVETDNGWEDATVTAGRSVVLGGGYMDRRFIKERSGAYTSKRSKGAGCYLDDYGPSLEMACWRGTYAKATWVFRLPVNATNVRESLFGPSGYNHGGVLQMDGRRINPRTFVVTARVTKWRQEFFETIRVRYLSRVRV